MCLNCRPERWWFRVSENSSTDHFAWISSNSWKPLFVISNFHSVVFFGVFLYPINIALIKSRYYIVFPKYGPSFLMTSEFWGLGRLWGTSDRLSKTEHFVWKLCFNADILFIYFLFFPLYNLGPNWQGVLSATEVMMLLIATWPNRVMLFCAMLLSEPQILMRFPSKWMSPMLPRLRTLSCGNLYVGTATWCTGWSIFCAAQGLHAAGYRNER